MRIFLLAIPVVLGCGSSKEVTEEEFTEEEFTEEEFTASCGDYLKGMNKAYAVCEPDETESEEEVSAWITSECGSTAYIAVKEADCIDASMSLFACGDNAAWAAQDCSGDLETPPGCESELESYYKCLGMGREDLDTGI